MNFDIIIGAAIIGLIYGLVALGVYLTIRIVDFPDMTVNSSFTLGASVSTVMIIHDIHPVIAMLCASVSGSIAGFITAFLNLKCKIQNLLASIIVMIGLYSINFRIMARPNIVILDQDVIYTGLNTWFVTVVIVFFITAALSYFLISEIGLSIRVSGQNPIMGNAYGVNYDYTTYLTLLLSNALVAFSGSLLSQLQGFCDINMGNGVIIIGLASVVIGEKLVMSSKILFIPFACICGAIIYNLLMAFALKASGSLLQPSDIYLITAILIIIVMMSKKRGRDVN